MKSLFLPAFIGLILLATKASACSFQLMIPKNVKTTDVKAALTKITPNFDYDEATKVAHFKLEREVTQAEVEKALSSSNLATVIVMPPAGKKSKHQ